MSNFEKMKINEKLSNERSSSDSSIESLKETAKLISNRDFNYTSFENTSITNSESEIKRFGNTKKCPTCQGSGKINLNEEHKLVALIPLSDSRLQPKTKRILLWIICTIILCGLISALSTYLLAPRAIIITNDTINVKPYNITYIFNSTDIIGLAISFNEQYVIKNNNFYPLNMINLTLELTRINIVTEPDLTYNQNELISPLSSVTINVKVKYIMYKTDDAYTDLCIKNKIHDLFTLISTTFSFSAIWNSYQESHLKSIQYISCNINNNNKF